MSNLSLRVRSKKSTSRIHVKTGGFLGLGGKIVVIPGAKITKGGDAIQLTLTSEDVSKPKALPERQG